MSQKTKERIRLIYGIALSVMIVAVGVCFALSCLTIYQSGSSPFTRESIATHWGYIAVPAYLCLAAVLGGFILSLIMPVTEGKIQPRREAYATLCKLRAGLDSTKIHDSVASAMAKEQSNRRVWLIQAAVVTAVCAVIPMVWCLLPGRFSVQNLNDDVKHAALMILPYVVGSLIIWMDTVIMFDRSVAAETRMVKAAKASAKGGGAKQEKALSPIDNLTSNPLFVWVVRGVILVVGVLFIVLGIFNGGMADVLGKAIRICTECIGLG